MSTSRFSNTTFIRDRDFDERYLFMHDSFPKKIDLTQTLRQSDGSWVPPAADIAKKAVARDDTLDRETLPTLGMPAFNTATTRLVLGPSSSAIIENRAFCVQTPTSTTALRVAAELLRSLRYKRYYCSDPSRPEQHFVFGALDFEESGVYRYWSPSKKELNFEGMIEDLKNVPQNSIIILYACGHNPTGCDPSQEQWLDVADVIKGRNCLPIFEMCCQGLVSGDLNEDAWPIRMFIEKKIELICCYAYARSFSVAGKGASALICVLRSSLLVPKIKAKLQAIVMALYGSPPWFAAHVVTYVLQNDLLYNQWKEQVKAMFQRIVELRRSLRNAIEQLTTPGEWGHITSQKGIYCFIGLTQEQIDFIRRTHHIYILYSGRISMMAVDNHCIPHIAEAVYDAVTNDTLNDSCSHLHQPM